MGDFSVDFFIPRIVFLLSLGYLLRFLATFPFEVPGHFRFESTFHQEVPAHFSPKTNRAITERKSEIVKVKSFK